MKSKSDVDSLISRTALNTVGAVSADAQATPDGLLPDGLYFLEAHAAATRNPTAGAYAAAKSASFEVLVGFEVRGGIANFLGMAPASIIASTIGADYAGATLTFKITAATTIVSEVLGVAAEDINWRVWTQLHAF
jgi:hypothetical protein